MRARVAHDVEHHEGDAGEMHDEQLELSASGPTARR